MRLVGCYLARRVHTDTALETHTPPRAHTRLSPSMNSNTRFTRIVLVVLVAVCADWCKYVPVEVWSEVARCRDCV